MLFQTASYGDVGLDGNSIAVLTRDGVLVFDTNGTPAASAAVLAEIRTLTDRPVRWIVNSHWHWDHWYGTETYQHAFPGVRIVAHEKTRALMVTITGDDPSRNNAFKVQLVDWYLHRVYEELDGPLSDAIAPIPAT